MVITRTKLAELNALIHEEAILRSRRASMAGHLEWVANEADRKIGVANIAAMDKKLRDLHDRMIAAGLEVEDGSEA